MCLTCLFLGGGNLLLLFSERINHNSIVWWLFTQYSVGWVHGVLQCNSIYITNKFNCNWVAFYAGWLNLAIDLPDLWLSVAKHTEYFGVHSILSDCSCCSHIGVSSFFFLLVRRWTRRRNLEYCDDSIYNKFWFISLSTTNFDLFPSSEVNRVTRCRFCDDKRADDHEKARVSAVSKKNWQTYTMHVLHTLSMTQCVLTGLPWLKTPPLHLLFVHKSGRISFYCQAVVRQHRWTPFALICLLHCWDNMMKIFIMLIIQYRTVFVTNVLVIIQIKDH